MSEPLLRRKAIRGAAKAALLILVAWLAWKYVDFRALGRSLVAVSPGSLFLMIAVVTADRFAMAYKWRFIGDALGLGFRYLDCLKAYYASTLVNFLVPTSLGGDLYRGVRLAGEGHPAAPVFATIVMEKVVNSVASLLWAWAGWIYLGSALSPAVRNGVGVALVLATAIGGTAMLCSALPALHHWIVRRLRWFGLEATVDALDRAFEAYRQFAGAKGRVVAATALGTVENLWDYGLYVLAGIALGIDVPWDVFLAVVVVNHIVRKLALYLNSWSVVEAVTVAAFGLAGVAPHEAVAIAVLRHAVSVVSTLPGALILVKGRKRKG